MANASHPAAAAAVSHGVHGAAEQAAPLVLGRSDVSGWRSAALPLALLALMTALLVQSCLDQPELPPRFDAVAATRSANEHTLQALQALPESASASEIIKTLNLMAVNFTSASAQVPQESEKVLQAAAQALLSRSEEQTITRMKIVGYTDNQGSVLKNRALSVERAQAVRDVLIAVGIPAERIAVSGAGDSRPVASNATEAGRFANRRIEFIALEDEE